MRKRLFSGRNLTRRPRTIVEPGSLYFLKQTSEITFLKRWAKLEIINGRLLNISNSHRAKEHFLAIRVTYTYFLTSSVVYTVNYEKIFRYFQLLYFLIKICKFKLQYTFAENTNIKYFYLRYSKFIIHNNIFFS